jgi:type I restriction enzyme S subunit
MNNWKKKKIEDVCDFIGGSQPPKSTFINIPKAGYTRLVQTRDFKTDKFPTYIKTNSTTKFFCKEDIIIGRYGPPIFQIFRGALEGAYNVALMKAVPKENITTAFLYYFLIQKEVFEYVDKLSARTGGQTGVDLASLYKYPIRLPEITTQQKIASILSALDSKIELNNRINAELEAMAKTLYDYWFVQFDFPDKNGKPYKTSGGKMVWNEELKREIPEGWEVKNLTEEMDLQYGFPFSTELFNDDGIGVPVIRIRDILNCSISNYSTEEVDNKYRIKKGDIIVGMDGNFHINYWNRDNCYLNQRSLRIRSNNESISEIQARYSIEPFIQAREKNVSRTTVAHLSAKDVNDLKILKAYNEFQIKANSFFNSNLEKIVSNKIQNHKLTELRDWLLPMLMNGQVRVN